MPDVGKPSFSEFAISGLERTAKLLAAAFDQRIVTACRFEAIQTLAGGPWLGWRLRWVGSSVVEQRPFNSIRRIFDSSVLIPSQADNDLVLNGLQIE